MIDILYKLPSEVKIFHHNTKVIFINPKIPTWFVTNELGKMIVSLFDGTNTIQDVVDTAAVVLGENLRNQLRTFCDNIVDSGIFENRPRPQPKRDRSVHCVHLSMSSVCNLHCKYCYAAERTESKYPAMTLNDYINVIDALCEMSLNITFTITGGEPLLNPLWLPVAEYIKNKGCKLFLLSNGLLINEDNISQIKILFDLVTISIDGATREAHSRTRGDNFNNVMNTILLLDAHKINYTLSMTVTSLNIEQVEPMAQRFGARLNFAPLFPISTYAHDKLSITGREYYQALSSAFGVNPLSYCESSLDGSRFCQNHKCAIGDNEISISATGDVYPCQLLHMKKFLAGNIHEQSIKDIVQNSAVLRMCSQLDVDKIEKCKECAIRYICGGSCRARGFYETGALDKMGDFCEYEFSAFLDGITKIYSCNVL